MESTVLAVSRRTGTGKNASRRLRAEGTVPAVVYGSGQESVNIHLRANPLVAILKSKMGPNSVIQLEIDGEAGPTVIVRDYQIHPVRRTLFHVDFLRVTDESILVVEVPIRIVGRAEVEKAGGKRRIVTPSMKVRCKPGDIPEAIQYDVTPIVGSKVVYVTDLEMPAGVEADYRRTFPVVSITAPKAATQQGDEEPAA